jgi:DNA processing protein
MTSSLLMSQITPAEENYPSLLKETAVPPSPLYFLGELPKKSDVLVAIVGTRKASRDGLLIAKQISKELARAGAVVVSGLALGIDGAAHEGAVTAGGRTIAVLATGLDSIYPRTHENLAKKLLDLGGAIFSEYPAGTPPFPNQFLERNRIVSGLSVATVVIEAPVRSGALVTARFALEEGRELFVVPGPISHRNYEGSHMLIRNGARLITNVSDLLEDLENTMTNHQLNLPMAENKNGNFEFEDERDALIFDTIKNGSGGLTVDNLSENTNLETYIVNERLTFLILKGMIRETGGRFVLNKLKR